MTLQYGPYFNPIKYQGEFYWIEGEDNLDTVHFLAKLGITSTSPSH